MAKMDALSIFTHYQPAPNSKTLPIPVFRNFTLSFTVFVAIRNTSAFPVNPTKTNATFFGNILQPKNVS